MEKEPFPYRPLNLLREGPSASVFEAQDCDGGLVVIKRANPDGLRADPLGSRRFERELRLASTLHHPGLATVRAQGDDWIAFERLGPSLRDEDMRKRFAAPDMVRSLIADLAGTLAFLHARGIVHRDVKPAHVMFRGDRPVLVDLGVAGLVAGDPLEGEEIVGSPAWMAPEQAAGARPAPTADVWSLAALCAWLVLGTPPYEGSADDVLDMRRRGAPPAFRYRGLRRIGGSLADIIEAGLGEVAGRPSASRIANTLLADVRR